jgi:outer membrane protein
MKSNHFTIALLTVVALMPSPALAQANQTLTLRNAEQIALHNHPQIQAAANIAAASEARVTQARSAYYPTVYGSATGAYAENDSRIGAGALNNPVIYDRFAEGITASQLVTDFGRTHELVKSSSLHAQAQQENVVTTRADVLLQVDQSYFAALKAQAVLAVAQETVKARQLVSDQITELEKNKIKSGLDVSFANVDLAQAQLLLIQAQNDLEASFAQLSDALGYSDERTFVLSEEAIPSTPPAALTEIVQEALRDRPELVGQRLDANAASYY